MNIKPLSSSTHRDFLKKFETIPIYYTPSWHNLNKALCKGKSQIMGIYEKEHLQAIIPFTRDRTGKGLWQALVSQPWGAWGGFFPHSSAGLHDAFFRHLSSEGGADMLLIHNNPLQSATYQEGILKEDNETHILELEGTPEKIWNCYTSRKRNDIRRALKKGVTVELYEEEEAAGLAWKLYEESLPKNSAKKGMKYSRSYFQHAFSELGSALEFYVACKNKQIIAGSLFYRGKNIIHYAFAMGKRAYYHLNAHSLIIWKICQSYAGQIRYLDLGASQQQRSLIRFKEAFRPQSVKLPCYAFPLNKKGKAYLTLHQIRKN